MPVPESNPAYQLAAACHALREVEDEKAEAVEMFKQRIKVLKGEIKRLSEDILTGQTQLPLELPEEPSDRKSAGAN